MNILEKIKSIIRTFTQKKLPPPTNTIKENTSTKNQTPSLSEQIQIVRGEDIPSALSYSYPNQNILPLNKESLRSTYLIEDISKIPSLSCYKEVAYSINRSGAISIKNLHTFYMDTPINEFSFKNDPEYAQAIKNVLIPPHRVEAKKKIAEAYGLKDVCYVGHIEKYPQKDPNTGETKLVYTRMAYQGNAEKSILTTLAKLYPTKRKDLQENLKILPENQKPITTLFRDTDTARLQELASNINGLRKYLMTTNNNISRTFYSEGINFDLLNNPLYNKMVLGLLDEERLQQKENIARQHGCSSCYVGTISLQDGKLICNTKQGELEKKIYSLIQQHDSYTHNDVLNKDI